MEKFTGSTVKEMLIKSGYKSERDLLMLNEGSISNIQRYVRHEILPVNIDKILNIPEQIREVKKSKITENKPKSPLPKNLTKVNLEWQPTIKSKTKGKRISKLSKKDLQDQLIFQIVKDLKDLGFPNENITVKHMKTYDEYKIASCFVECPFCPKVYNMSYGRLWKTFSIFRHFENKHSKLSEQESRTKPSSATATSDDGIRVFGN